MFKRSILSHLIFPVALLAFCVASPSLLFADDEDHAAINHVCNSPDIQPLNQPADASAFNSVAPANPVPMSRSKVARQLDKRAKTDTYIAGEKAPDQISVLSVAVHFSDEPTNYIEDIPNNRFRRIEHSIEDAKAVMRAGTYNEIQLNTDLNDDGHDDIVEAHIDTSASWLTAQDCTSWQGQNDIKDRLYTQADAQARAQGFDPESYLRVVYFFPKSMNTHCRARGESPIGHYRAKITERLWVAGDIDNHFTYFTNSSYLRLRDIVMPHELAHSFGLSHVNYYSQATGFRSPRMSVVGAGSILNPIEQEWLRARRNYPDSQINAYEKDQVVNLYRIEKHPSEVGGAQVAVVRDGTPTKFIDNSEETNGLLYLSYYLEDPVDFHHGSDTPRQQSQGVSIHYDEIKPGPRIYQNLGSLQDGKIIKRGGVTIEQISRSEDLEYVTVRITYDEAPKSRPAIAGDLTVHTALSEYVRDKVDVLLPYVDSDGVTAVGQQKFVLSGVSISGGHLFGGIVSTDPNYYATGNLDQPEAGVVSFRVFDGYSWSNTGQITLITGEPSDTEQPRAVIDSSGPSNTDAPYVLSVDASSSVANGQQLRYQWNFGDGSSSTDEKTFHTYTQAGTYTVHLTVTDATGQSSSKSITVLVTETTAPVTDLCPNTLFDNGKMWSGDIQFVDNTCGNAEQVCPQTYFSDKGGRFDAVCNGAKWIKEGAVSAPNLPPAATVFTTSPVLVPVPFELEFDASLSRDDNDQLNYAWDFGDGTIDNSAGVTNTHRYTEPGTYIMTLTVTDELNQSDTASLTVIARPNTNTGNNTPDLCPNTLFDDGKMWSGDIQYVDNTCSNAEQVCPQTFFSDKGRRLNAVCTGTQWIEAGAEPEPEPEPEPEAQPEPVVAELCPNTLFDDGKMWSGDIRYVDNTCRNADQVCPQTYFSDKAKRADAVCADGKWQLGG